MAKLSARGRKNRIIEALYRKTAVCSDGVILRSHGRTWSQYGKLKDPDKWLDVAANMQAKLDAARAARPKWRAFAEALMAFKLEDRIAIRHSLDDIDAGRDPDEALRMVTQYKRGPISRLTTDDLRRFQSMRHEAEDEARAMKHRVPDPPTPEPEPSPVTAPPSRRIIATFL